MEKIKINIVRNINIYRLIVVTNRKERQSFYIVILNNYSNIVLNDFFQIIFK